ncbi:MAG: hypothetical protein HZA77_07690 [Candidatus Schekmanbacteria bacterium]|nr:hypothetical protein [Candidatus Schekmanbacteria bacterium]
MPGLYNDRILIVDLSEGEVNEKGCGADFFNSHIGGAKANLALYKEYESDDPIVIGCGPFTGTLFPGGAAAIVTCKSPLNGEVVHFPILLNGGMEFKLSGFDFVVIKGKSEEPVYLWLHDEIGDLNDAGQYWGKSTWEITEALRKDMAEDLVQVISIGVAGENGSKAAQLCHNYWGTADKWNIAGVFGAKNLKAVAFRGLGLIEIESSQDFIDGCAGLKKEIISGSIKGKYGILACSEAIGAGETASWAAPSIHRMIGCFACPYNCNTFLKYNESPQACALDGVDAPGFLLTDLASAIKLKAAGFSSADAGRVLELSAKLGLEPVQVAKAIAGKGKTFAEVEDAVTSLSQSGADNVEPYSDAWGEKAASSFSAWAPNKKVFSTSDASREELNALAYTLGVCPLFMLMASEITLDKVSELLSLGAGIEKSADEIKEIIKSIG